MYPPDNVVDRTSVLEVHQVPAKIGGVFGDNGATELDRRTTL
jgi:hypothetical protein